MVLDTVGSLDVVGSTPWFGLPGERIEGIRFDGDTGYAVTFLQTDPFYVLDLSDPVAPKVAGEVKLPGFSAYLHPVGAGLVAGFGPGASGRTEVKLFDVSNPAAPRVVDELILGDESPIVYDHHAFVSLGEGRFALPVTNWSDMGNTDGNLGNQVVEVQVAGSQLREVARVSAQLPEPVSRALRVDGGWALLGGSQIEIVDQDGTQRGSISI